MAHMVLTKLISSLGVMARDLICRIIDGQPFTRGLTWTQVSPLGGHISMCSHTKLYCYPSIGVAYVQAVMWLDSGVPV